MLKDLTTLEPFFQDPTQVYSAREIARNSHMSHVTVTKRLKEYKFIERAKYGPYKGYKTVITPEYTRLRYIWNYLRIYNSGLIGHLLREYGYPTIVLFGSFATATQDTMSDIDLLLITEKKDEIKLNNYERILGHKIHLFIHTKKELANLKKTNPQLVNSWCNGIVLHGELEVF